MRIQMRIILGLALLAGAVGLWGCGASGIFAQEKTVRVDLGQELFQPQGGTTEDYGVVEGYVYQPDPEAAQTGEDMKIFTPEEVPADGKIEGYVPVAGATVELQEANGAELPGSTTTDEQGFFHLVSPESPPATDLEITAQTDSDQAVRVIQAEPIPVRQSFFRRQVHIARPDIPSYVEVEVRSVSLEAIVYNDGQVPIQGTLYYSTPEEDAAAGGINAENVQYLAVPFYVLRNPEEPTDTILEPGESWVLEGERIENFSRRPEGTPPGPSIRDLINQAPKDVYVYGLLEPENANVSLRNVEVIIRAKGGPDLF
jgi:hypothetical protein